MSKSVFLSWGRRIGMYLSIDELRSLDLFGRSLVLRVIGPADPQNTFSLIAAIFGFHGQTLQKSSWGNWIYTLIQCWHSLGRRNPEFHGFLDCQKPPMLFTNLIKPNQRTNSYKTFIFTGAKPPTITISNQPVATTDNLLDYHELKLQINYDDRCHLWRVLSLTNLFNYSSS